MEDEKEEKMCEALATAPRVTEGEWCSGGSSSAATDKTRSQGGSRQVRSGLAEAGVVDTRFGADGVSEKRREGADRSRGVCG